MGRRAAASGAAKAFADHFALVGAFAASGRLPPGNLGSPVSNACLGPTAASPGPAAPAAGPRLVLASTSPRRRQLLQEAGFAFEWLDPGVDEFVLGGEASPASVVAALAHLKAFAGAERLNGLEGALVLGADTVCVTRGRLVGKAADADEARAILESFSGAEHDVLSGVSLLSDNGRRREILVDRARVVVGRLDRSDIDAYLATGAWRGKAGGYNLFERLEAGWPIAFHGDPSTVVGLPMRRLWPLLDDLLQAEAAC